MPFDCMEVGAVIKGMEQSNSFIIVSNKNKVAYTYTVQYNDDYELDGEDLI